MAIVNCPECSKKLKVADTSVGKKVKCTCGTVFVAEAADALSAAPPLDEKALVACTECGSKLKVAPTSLGKKMKCPKCAGVFVAALPAAMAEETMKRPAPAENDEEPMDFAAAESREDEEDLPNSRAKSRKLQEDDEEEDDAPQPAAKPVYPSRLFVNLFVFVLVLAYGAFFAVTHPDINLWDLKLIKQRPILPAQIRGANENDGPKSAPFKGKGQKDKGKPADVKKDDANKENGKKDDAKDEKQSNLGERLCDPGFIVALVFSSLDHKFEGALFQPRRATP